MARCEITPLKPKACSGKCMSSACGSVLPRVWVAAACEGMVSLFEKHPDGHITLASKEASVFPSMAAFHTALQHAGSNNIFDQLIIVGGKNDLAWLHASLPTNIAKRVTAEIEYPLIPGWFKEVQPLHKLSHALEHVFSA